METKKLVFSNEDLAFSFLKKNGFRLGKTEKETGVIYTNNGSVIGVVDLSGNICYSDSDDPEIQRYHNKLQALYETFTGNISKNEHYDGIDDAFNGRR